MGTYALLYIGSGGSSKLVLNPIVAWSGTALVWFGLGWVGLGGLVGFGLDWIGLV